MTKRTLICLVLGSLIVIPSACGTDSEEESSTEKPATGIDAKTTGTGVGPKEPAKTEAPKEVAPPAGGGDTVNIKDFKYEPDSIKVKMGAKLVFANVDSAAHTATADDDSFDTGSLERGAKKTVTLEKAGSISYICDFHPYMKGTVEVE